jgi:valyl-tRNA synthetase
MQWFLKLDTLSKPALENVMNDNVQLIPEKFKNTYKHWMENVHDWCISRQLWWGQRIPAWYLANQNDIFVVAKTETEALELFKSKGHDVSSKDIKQDDDVLDTWASSWLWPMAVFQKMDGDNDWFWIGSKKTSKNPFVKTDRQEYSANFNLQEP